MHNIVSQIIADQIITRCSGACQSCGGTTTHPGGGRKCGACGGTGKCSHGGKH
ncbi:hypothetical protein [Actinomadura xylanilytica]|uniref:hypothetical protein n=1 Tax=Actinomadura xylanilytica TaxID=887459 RepID=UPI00255AAE2F|nr:hypothetical protein [Actinomadura xylanilytica]MDL4777874.1 hypothetical protein [Actinomadura xylanilytica]